MCSIHVMHTNCILFSYLQWWRLESSSMIHDSSVTMCALHLGDLGLDPKDVRFNLDLD